MFVAAPCVLSSSLSTSGRLQEYTVVVRDVRERGRDIEGCVKQWFAFVKPNFFKYVQIQRDIAGQS